MEMEQQLQQNALKKLKKPAKYDLKYSCTFILSSKHPFTFIRRSKPSELWFTEGEGFFLKIIQLRLKMLFLK
jgi:hypothetical protein